MRNGENVYLYGTDLTGYPTNVDFSMADSFDGPDLMRSIVTFRFFIEEHYQREKFRAFKHFLIWREEDMSHQFVIPGGQNVTIPGPQYPLSVEAQVPLKFISDVPFDGMPSGRLLYGKEDDT